MLFRLQIQTKPPKKIVKPKKIKFIFNTKKNATDYTK